MHKLLKEMISDPVTGTTVIEYSYDAVGNRLRKIENGVSTTYTYDDNNRLIAEGDIIYAYDENKNFWVARISPISSPLVRSRCSPRFSPRCSPSSFS